MSDMTIAVKAEVEVESRMQIDSMRWESPDTFLLDLAFDPPMDTESGGVVVALSAADARRLAEAIQGGLR